MKFKSKRAVIITVALPCLWVEFSGINIIQAVGNKTHGFFI